MPYEVNAWLLLLARWWHIFSAILWIGQTYLFHRLERNLAKNPDTPDNVLGDLWMVHGGGFFYLEKQKFPATAPKELLWFKNASGSTWLSGAVLTYLTYYNGGILVSDGQNYWVGAAAGIGTVVVGFALSDLTAKFLKNDVIFGAPGSAAIVGLAYFLRDVMTPRSVFIHIAALMGTIMAANVWMRIIPTMHKIIAVRETGKEADESLLAVGPRRSKHNSYIVSPLILLMISNHFPVISYGHECSYLVVGVWLVMGWAFARLMKYT